jgi:uncharacterized membrane protein
VNCVDQLSAALCDFAAREMPPAALADRDGRTRVVLAREVTFERLLGSAYDQIRQTASFHTTVYLQLMAALRRIATCTASAHRLDDLERCGDLVLAASQEEVAAEADRAVVRRRYEGFHDVVCEARRSRFPTHRDVVGG